MKKNQEQKEIKAENLVDDFVKQWREKSNTRNAVYAHYHYDAMIAFAEYFKEISKSEQAKEMEKEQKAKLWTNEEVFDMLYKTDKFLMVDLREYWKTIQK